MAASEVLLGQFYEPSARAASFLRSRVWTVVGLFVGTDGHDYAQLVNFDDRSLVKTLSVSALTDPGIFVRREA